LLTSFWLGCEQGLSEYDGVTSPAYDILRKASDQVDERFYTYLFRTEKSQAIFKRHSRGIMDVRLRLYFDKFGAITVITVPFPSISEQEAIAHYLDTKIAQIDRKIDLLTQKAKRYEELKRVLINETVTRSLDKSVPMKDSAIEWIGEIPEHWKVQRVKELTTLVLGKMLDHESAPKKFYHYYLKSKNITWFKVDISSVVQMYFTPHEMKAYRLKVDNLLLSEGGEVGKTSIWREELNECYIQNSVHKVTVFKSQHPQYHLYQSVLLGQLKYYDSIVNQVSIKHLTKEKLSRVFWLCPPLEEQKAIAQYLDTKTAQIDQIIQTINTQIEKLKELRKTLINDVVTGKIKVIDN